MKRIFSFGASTAQGALDTEEGGFIMRIGKRLEQEHLGHAENFGIGGHTTNDMVLRLTEIPIHAESDIAIVTLGVNDIARTPDPQPEKRVALAKHSAQAEEILEYMKSRCQVLYVTQYPIAFADRGLEESLVVSYVDAGRRIAKIMGIDVLDIYREIDDAKYSDFIADDGMHFNSAGHAYIAERIWAVLFSDS